MFDGTGTDVDALEAMYGGVTVTERDYLRDMIDVLDQRTPTTAYVAAVFAAELVDELRITDPDLLHGWLDKMAVHTLRDVIATRARSKTGRARSQATKVSFSEATAKFEAGDVEALSVFSSMLVVNELNLRRPVGEMTNLDHFFVRDSYSRIAKTSKMEAAFHDAVGKRIPDGETTASVMDEDTYLRLRESIVSR